MNIHLPQANPGVPLPQTIREFISKGCAGAIRIDETTDEIIIPEVRMPFAEASANEMFLRQLVDAFCQTNGIITPAERTPFLRFKAQVIRPSPIGQRVICEFTADTLPEATYKACIKFKEMAEGGEVPGLLPRPRPGVNQITTKEPGTNVGTRENDKRTKTAISDNLVQAPRQSPELSLQDGTSPGENSNLIGSGSNSTP